MVRSQLDLAGSSNGMNERKVPTVISGVLGIYGTYIGLAACLT